MTITVEEVLPRLTGVRKSGDGWVARCPGHEDKRASLSVGAGQDGKVLLNCFAGCEYDHIIEALGIENGNGKADRPQIVAEYDYTDEDGKPLFQVVRYAPKDFRQRVKTADGWSWKLGNTRRVLYRMPAVVKAIAAGQPVFLVEGEKDVHTIEKLGLVGTTSPGGGGAGKWRAEYTKALTGARVVILPDNDEPGRAHAATVAEAIGKVAEAVVTVELPGLPEKGDVTDWKLAGGTREALLDLAAAAFEADRPKPVSLTSWEATYGFLEDYQRRKDGQVKGLPLPPAWGRLGRVLGPLEPGTFTIIAARPSVGKTIFTLQLQAHLCDLGHRVLYVTRELTPDRLVRRHIVSEGARMDDLRAGTLSPDGEKAVVRYVERQSSWAVHYDATSRTPAEIKREAELVAPDCIVIDYLQRLAYQTTEEYAALTRLVNDLQDLATDLGVPVVCASQLKRPQQGREHKPPTMSDARGSGAVEERATSLVLLHRQYVTEKDEWGHEVATARTDAGSFIVAKNADGEAGVTIPTVIEGYRMRIIERGDY